MYSRLVALLIVGILATACSRTKPLLGGDDPPLTYFDSLIKAQVVALTGMNATISKRAIIGKKQDQLQLTPDSLGWARELDIFRQLEQFERASNRGAYLREDSIRDSKSNLTIRKFRAIHKVPVTEVNFFYFGRFSNIKRIEATYSQHNLLYSTSRRLTMEFEQMDGRSLLTSFSVDGVQKMVLGDTVKFFVIAQVVAELE